MIFLEINNNKIRVSGNPKECNIIFEGMKVRHPNAFYLRPYMERGWDGKIKYISDSGYAKTGLLPMITSKLKKLNIKYQLKDSRNTLEVFGIPSKIKHFKAFKHQKEAVESIINNKVDEIPFQRGIIDAATNAGKTLMALMLHLAFKNLKTLILVNNSPLYKQFLEDIPKLYNGSWGQMQGKKVVWGDLMICMTPTLVRNLSKYSRILAGYEIVLFDECHLASSKTNKKIITALYNTVVRVGLSGTPLLHKDPTKNMDIISFFGDVVYKISNMELMENGISSPIVVKISKGSVGVREKGDYTLEYDNAIIDNNDRDKIILSRINFYMVRDQFPILVLARYHRHVEKFYKRCIAKFGDRYKVAFLHGGRHDRYETLERFKKGEIDILISSLLIKLGQNMPLIKTLINISGGDSHINTLQIVGRLIRKHESKTKVYLEDFWDEGFYQRRHSFHRVKYYKKEGFKVIELYKKTK